MNVEPLRDFVVVKKEEATKQTPGGIYMPGTSEEKMVTGEVLAVGPGLVTDAGVAVPLAVKVGDRVVFNRNAAVEVKNGGETVHLVNENQLICRLS